MRLGLFLLAGTLAFSVACATGVETDDEPFGPLATGDGGFGGSGGDDTRSTSSSGGMGGMGEMGGMGGMPPSCLYDSPNTCQTATPLSNIAGDEGGPTIMEVGETSEWFQIRIEERVSSILEEDLSFTVTLTNPPNMDFDLFVLMGPQDGNPNCNATPIPGVKAGNVQTVQRGWDDDQGLGGEDDDVWLCIEVRYVSGMECGNAAQWSLTVKGHT
jgi:hypothetical protein